MNSSYSYNIVNPNPDNLGYIIAMANVLDKQDRSAPSHFHWKILKCRMMLFSNSSILACPDKKDEQQIHIIFNKMGDDYDKINSLFLKFSLVQDGPIRNTTPEVFQMCFHYTLTARLAPVWNTLGCSYLVNNRDFLVNKGPDEGIRYHICCKDKVTVMELKPIKINLMRTNDDFMPGEWVRVLPSLNKAIIEDNWQHLPDSGDFKNYKDLRRHWKNIHGYRLPDEESSYFTVQFWRGEPLTYPKICVVRNYPVVTPVPKSTEKIVLSRFLNCVRNKLPYFLGVPLTIQCNDDYLEAQEVNGNKFPETQAVSLCTPTQHTRYTTSV